MRNSFILIIFIFFMKRSFVSDRSDEIEVALIEVDWENPAVSNLLTANDDQLEGRIQGEQLRRAANGDAVAGFIRAMLRVDVSEQAADRDYLVAVADFEAWEGRHGRLPDGGRRGKAPARLRTRPRPDGSDQDLRFRASS